LAYLQQNYGMDMYLARTDKLINPAWLYLSWSDNDALYFAKHKYEASIMLIAKRIPTDKLL
jgi:hypothetical protein